MINIKTTILTKTKKINLQKLIRNVLFFGFLVFISLYITFNTRLVSKGISLSIDGIENGKIYTEGSLEIDGNAKRAKHLLVNGREVYLDQEGNFKDLIILLPGYNVISVTAEDKFGKVTKNVFEIIREEEIINLASSKDSSL